MCVCGGGGGGGVGERSGFETMIAQHKTTVIDTYMKVPTTAFSTINLVGDSSCSLASTPEQFSKAAIKLTFQELIALYRGSSSIKSMVLSSKIAMISTKILHKSLY